MTHPEIDRQLRRERTRRQLCERKAFLVILLGDPATTLDEVSLHVAGKRDRTAEAESAQSQEVGHELAEGTRLQETATCWQPGGSRARRRRDQSPLIMGVRRRAGVRRRLGSSDAAPGAEA